MSANALAADRIPFDEWRAFRDENRAAERPRNFVDGEFVERFLDLDEAEQRAVVLALCADGIDDAHVAARLDELRDIVAGLRQLH